MKKVGLIIGTRPEAIKLIPVYKQLKLIPEIKTSIIFTKQHNEMAKQVFALFQIAPELEIDTFSKDRTLNNLSSQLISKLSDVFKKEKFDLVVVQGDTTTALCGALCAFHEKIPIAHVEAGLRTKDKSKPFPEEMNRRCISNIADIHFAPTEKAMLNLRNEGILEGVFYTGNTVVDCLEETSKVISSNSHLFEYLKNKVKNFENGNILITAHRRENFGVGIKSICEAVGYLAKKYTNYNFIFPVHLNPNVHDQVSILLSNYPNVYLFPPLRYDEMVFWLNNCMLILTDSGGIQEEAPTFGVPVVVMRDSTERPEGVIAGCAHLVGTDSNKIIDISEKLITNSNQKRSYSNPYGDGMASQRISKIISDYLA